MEPEIQPAPAERPRTEHTDIDPTPDPLIPEPQDALVRWLRWTFIGDSGLRAGWSVAIFIVLFLGLIRGVGKAFVTLFPGLRKADFSPGWGSLQELVPFLAMLAAAAFVAFIERRRILDYNLIGPQRPLHFVSGLIAGFAALSMLVGALSLGGWLHFGPIALSGVAIFQAGVLWGCCFLLVGLVEEGTFRCYLQFTLTRGINFWWALACVGTMCAYLLLRAKGNGVWGVYVIALLGLIPCLYLHATKSPGGGFWQAAWVTSSLFGFIHTGNNGENWIGIFAAALIGFVFCVSVRLTGSAWWAIGCHAAWDWGETFFYGTADSGFVAKGHYLTSTPAGPALWSGGTDGPEGSLLVIPVVLVLLIALLAIYGRTKTAPVAAPVLEQVAG
jgi:membrane protease YdiL (CAAX protease family)